MSEMTQGKQGSPGLVANDVPGSSVTLGLGTASGTSSREGRWWEGGTRGSLGMEDTEVGCGPVPGGDV